MSVGIDPGCIRIRVAPGGVGLRSIAVASERPQLTNVLRGRSADAAVALVPLLFALCGKAQGRAAELALAAARGRAMAPGLDPAIAAEAAREHVWRWLLDLPPLLGEAPLKEEFTAALGWIASGQRASLAALLDDPRLARFVQRLEAVEPPSDSTVVAQLPAMDAAASLRHWPRLDAAFCRQPNWRGGAAETGACARRGGGPGHAFALRWQARLAELRDWAQGTATVGAGGTASAVPVAPGIGRALVETARGLLMHELVLDGDKVAEYFIVAPTEWNFHPQGPLAGWLGGAEVEEREALRARAALAVATLDPCVRWELEGL